MLTGATPAAQADLDSLSEATEMQAEVQSEAAINAVLTGAIAKVVYKSAIEAVPDSIDFRQGFLKILSQFKFEGVNALQQDILASIQRDFGDTEEAWDVRARAASNDQASTSEVNCYLLPNGRTPYPCASVHVAFLAASVATFAAA